MTKSLVSSLVGWFRTGDAESEEETPPDVVWVDHRDSNCMMPVQDQNNCGSCYAFAVIAFYEWAHCKKTGERVKFSEQYIIDCGTRVEGLHGCEGGKLSSTLLFAKHFGFELARHYPYKGREEQCPYDERTPLRSMGYMRIGRVQSNYVRIGQIEYYLVHTPMVINVNFDRDLHWYGGGVYDGKGKPDGYHSMLIIGHGREDGEEYWLIRNSCSEDYGEQGHLKLNKNSDLIDPRVGFIPGNYFNNGVDLFATRNPLVPKPIKQLTESIMSINGIRAELKHQIKLFGKGVGLAG